MNQKLETPVWIRLDAAIALTSLGRSTLYKAIKDGKFKTKNVKFNVLDKRGTRLIHRQSLLKWIESSEDAGAAPIGTQKATASK